MATMTAEQIYANFHDAASTEMWQAAQQSVAQLSAEMPSLAADIKRLQMTMNHAWQGAAADIASQGAEPLALAYTSTADDLRRAQDLVGRQSDSFDSAARSVEPVPPEPTAVAILDSSIGEPNMEQQVTGYLNASQHNVDVYNQYHGASQYNTSNLPVDYSHLASDNTTITETTGPMPAAGTPGTAHLTPHTGQAAAHSSAGTTSVGAGPERANITTHPVNSPSTTGGSIPPAAAEPPVAVPPSTQPAGSTGPNGADPTGPEPSLDPPSSVTVPAITSDSVVDPAPVPIFDPPPTRGRTGGATGGQPLFGDAPGTIDLHGAAGARATGGLADPIDTLLTTERTGTPVPPAALGEPEIAPLTGMPARRRSSDDEDEHHVVTYDEPDPNDLFGVPECAVVPVIGE